MLPFEVRMICIIALLSLIMHSEGFMLSFKGARHTRVAHAATELGMETEAESKTAGRVYVPRGKVDSPSSGTSKRVYTPKGGDVRTRSFERGGRGGAGGGGRGRGSLLLTDPMLITKYAVPREKSELKIRLEEMQDQFQDESYNAYKASGGGGGGDIFAKFDPGSRGGFKGGKRKLKDGERKGSEGAKPKSETGGRGKGKNFAGEMDDDDFYDDDEDDDFDYYGDEQTVNLADIPGYVIRNMEQEGLTMEDIQISLYGEYGAKVSVAAIRRKLRDEQSKGRPGKTKKRTGKTRRERAKSRNARMNPGKEKPVALNEPTIMVKELSELMDVGAGQVVSHLMMNMGMMVTMTQAVDRSVAVEICEAFGKLVEGEGELASDDDDEEDEDEDWYEDTDGDEEVYYGADGTTTTVDRLPRAPVVTIMGHVDHGKTSLLDAIRKANVARGEAGGITQGISAFKVKPKEDDDSDVCFIDTPGHAAFSEMRKRGANVTDIVVLVVAADDGIMEQTKECIVAAKTANCPIVVAINKVDKEGADPSRVMTELMEYDILPEEFGGTVQVAQVSAKQGTGLEDLLDKVLIQADTMNLRAPVDTPAQGTVIEARMDKGMGVVSTVLISKGTLSIGDYILSGPAWGRVRKIVNDQGEPLDTAGPSSPVQVMGLDVIPAAGDDLTCGATEASVRGVAESRRRLARQGAGAAIRNEIIGNAAGILDGSIDRREILKVPVVIKGDVSGSIEAIRSSLEGLTLEDDDAICMADVVYQGVGDVTSSDISVAAVARAKILAFNVASSMNAMDDARSQNVEIGYYNVVYDLLDEMKETITTTLSPPPPGELVGRAEIKRVFKIGKVGRVAGCEVTEGSIRADSMVRVMRGRRNPVFTGRLKDLKIVKEGVQEVPEGSECGMSFDNFQDFEDGDVVECFSSKGLDAADDY